MKGGANAIHRRISRRGSLRTGRGKPVSLAARTVALTAALGAVLALTACGSDDNSPATSTPIVPPGSAVTAAPAVATTPSTPGVYAPMDTGKSQSGLEGLILSVEDTNTRYGPGVVVTFQVINTTAKPWDGYNWMTPTVVYGPAGTQAERIVSGADHLGDGVQGVIPPGARQTVREGYKVSKAELNPAVITAGSVVWQGDFATFQR